MEIKENLTYDDINIKPLFSEINHRSDCDTSTQFSRNTYIKIPLISSPMDTITDYKMASEMMRLGGVGVVHRFMTIKEQSKIISLLYCDWMVDKMDKTVPICAAIGVTGDWFERAEELIENGCNVLLLDIAHGHHKLVKEALEILNGKHNRKNFDVVAGSIATKDAAKDLCEWGADGIRVGIGNGSLCETRIRTGVGVPQVSVILDCVGVADDYAIPIIADGGIRYPADVVKGLALGADSIMVGSLLSGTKETPGAIEKVGEWPNEQLFKKYRGSASLESKLERNEDGKNIEGNSKITLYKGKTKRIINDIIDGLKSAMSYVGSKNLQELQSKCEFIKVTNAGIIEAGPHGLKKGLQIY